jgi:hypothetical protein
LQSHFHELIGKLERDNSCISPRELQGGAKFISWTISEMGQGKTVFLAFHRHKTLEFHEHRMGKKQELPAVIGRVLYY